MHAMLGWIMIGALTLACLGVVRTLWCTPMSFWIRHRRPAGRLCPGAPINPVLARLPWNWGRGRCGYDLGGLDAADACPECGTVTPPHRRLGAPRPSAPVVATLAAVLVAWGAIEARAAIRSGRYTKWVPTELIIALERPGPKYDVRLGRELVTRVWRGKVTGWRARWLASKLEAELVLGMPEERRGYAKYYWSDGDLGRARRLIQGLGEATGPALERLVVSDRPQAREFAADAMLERGWPPDDPRIMRVMADVVLDPLADDEWDGYGTWNRSSAARNHLDRHFAAAEDRLAEALRSGDRWDRYRAALLLLRHAPDRYAAEAAPVLVKHLADDQGYRNAAMAVTVLFPHAAACRAWLEAGAISEDRQRAVWCLALLAAADGASWAEVRDFGSDRSFLSHFITGARSAESAFLRMW